jgi:hypothetical protein
LKELRAFQELLGVVFLHDQVLLCGDKCGKLVFLTVGKGFDIGNNLKPEPFVDLDIGEWGVFQD